MLYAIIDGRPVSAYAYDASMADKRATCRVCERQVHHVGGASLQVGPHFRHAASVSETCPLASVDTRFDLSRFEARDKGDATETRWKCLHDHAFRIAVYRVWNSACRGFFSFQEDFPSAMRERIRAANKRDLWSRVGVGDGNIAYLLLLVASPLCVRASKENPAPRYFAYHLRRLHRERIQGDNFLSGPKGSPRHRVTVTELVGGVQKPARIPDMLF